MIYSLLFLSNILLRFTNLYNCYLFCIEYFLLLIYSLIIKFSIVSKLIIVFSAFLFILIFMCSWAVLVKTASLLAEAIPQYFFWLLSSEKSSSFLTSLRDISSGYRASYLDKILYIFYIYSGLHNYLLYRIAIVFVYNLWSVLFSL